MDVTSEMKSKQTSKEELVDKLLFIVGPLYSLKYPDIPGYIIEHKLNAEERELCKELTAKDFERRNMRCNL